MLRKNKAKLNRQLRSLNIGFLTEETTIKEIEEIPNLKDLVYDEAYESIRTSIGKKKIIKVELFEINNSGYVLDLPKDSWVKVLEKAISFYEKVEKYEKCADCKKLINEINEQGSKENKSSSKQYSRSRSSTKKKEKK